MYLLEIRIMFTLEANKIFIILNSRHDYHTSHLLLYVLADNSSRKMNVCKMILVFHLIVLLSTFPNMS